MLPRIPSSTSSWFHDGMWLKLSMNRSHGITWYLNSSSSFHARNPPNKDSKHGLLRFATATLHPVSPANVHATTGATTSELQCKKSCMSSTKNQERITVDIYIIINLDVSKNRGTPKWMVYNGKTYEIGWFGGTIIFGNTHFKFNQSGLQKATHRPWLLGLVLCSWQRTVSGYFGTRSSLLQAITPSSVLRILGKNTQKRLYSS